ncbi:MAG: hypothetical protein Q7K55_01570 [Candidatus Levybacteria bacterium]|nr:hypothetical protein [Candidatus Levybacteria bacterium]
MQIFWLSFFTLLLSNLIFSKFFYNFLFPFVGTRSAYLIDQGFPFLAVVIVSFFLIKKYWYKCKKNLSSNIIPILILTAVVISVHGLLTQYYFFAEDVTHILQSVKQGDEKFPFNPTNNGYPLFPFVFSFLLFGTNAIFYNIVSLLLFLAAVLGFYFFVISLTGNKNLALLSALFFGTTPSFLDMFAWQASVQGMSQVLFLGLMCFIFLVHYQKSKNNFCYFLSLLFFISAIHVGFVRIAGMIFPLLFLIIFPIVKVKTGIWKKVLQAIPFIVVWMEFVQIRFGMSLLAHPFKIIEGKNTSFDVSNYFSPLFYYLDHLFFPARVGRILFPWLKNELFTTFDFIQNVSFIFLFGLVIFAILSILALIAILRFKSISWRIVMLSLIFIFGNLFYVPLLGSVPKDIFFFDRQFINPAYNPGSRYVFSSAIGVSMLFGLLFLRLFNLKRKLRYIFFVFMIAIVIVNGFISFSAHKQMALGISKSDRSFMENFFSMVPQDGKKKIVYSTNPGKNMIDVNVGGSNWLYGFYKRDELDYINNKQEFLQLLNSKAYKKENIYTFYNNPETGAFENISSLFRDESFRVKKEEFIALNTAQKEFSIFAMINTSNGRINILNRPILETADLDRRIIFTQNLAFNLSFEKLTSISFPYSDYTILDKRKEIPYPLWEQMRQNYPAVFRSLGGVSPTIIESFNNIFLSDLPIDDKLSIIEILKDRERLRNSLKISASNINEEEGNMSADSLIDGSYTLEPRPGPGESFYLAGSTPVTIDMELPYAINLGRVLLNVSKAYSSDRSPVRVEVLASSGGLNFENVGSYSGGSVFPWSPNNGKMIKIDLVPVSARYVKIVIEKTDNYPVMLDEIILDNNLALEYTPWQIGEYQNKGFQFVENQQLLDVLDKVGYYNKLSLFYVCAENSDWEKQESDFKMLVAGIWKNETIIVDRDIVNNISLPIDCYGSKLRKIIIIGPPYPIKMRIENARIE